MHSGAYRFAKDGRFEERRLACVERAFDGPTRAILIELGVRPGWACWDVGAGRGSVARWLARVVGPEGRVLATDLEDRRPQDSEPGVTWLVHDVLVDALPGRGFDLVHARFLLEHIVDPPAAIERLCQALRPGGVLVLEDSAGLALVADPPEPVLARIVPAWERAAESVGWQPRYGGRLISDMRLAALAGVRGRQCRHVAPGGDDWIHVADGVRRLTNELLECGASQHDLARVLECIADPARLITGPPVTVAWGWREGSDAVR